MCACEIDKNSESVTDNSVVTCDTTLDAVAKSYDNSTNFNEKKHLLEYRKFLYFICLFINYYIT